MTHAADGSEWARRTMARALVVTAPPDAPVPRAADVASGLPAPTMADDRGDQASMVPMGTRCAWLALAFFALLALRLRERTGQRGAQIRARHTNVE
jgi:hypothetical protein